MEYGIRVRGRCVGLCISYFFCKFAICKNVQCIKHNAQLQIRVKILINNNITNAIIPIVGLHNTNNYAL